MWKFGGEKAKEEGKETVKKGWQNGGRGAWTDSGLASSGNKIYDYYELEQKILYYNF